MCQGQGHCMVCAAPLKGEGRPLRVHFNVGSEQRVDVRRVCGPCEEVLTPLPREDPFEGVVTGEGLAANEPIQGSL